MYPNPVVAIPTPSTKTLSPTANGKSCPEEKSVSRVSSTVAEVVVNAHHPPSFSDFNARAERFGFVIFRQHQGER